ncbi:MAG TPA: PQQ-binding-like beta-propeller repeat protein [Acidimicrobiales bacterium]|nr:PQQ-binding-like beta-propeller repeat protein [Acidimicrobiales bacterium]
MAVVAAAATSAGCWWQPGGNANRSGHNGVESVIGLESAPALTEVWTAPGRTSTPVVVGSRVFSVQGSVAARNVTTGALLWETNHPMGDALEGFYDGAEVLASGGSPRSGFTVFELDAATGQGRGGGLTGYRLQALRGSTRAGQSFPDPTFPVRLSTLYLADVDVPVRNWSAVMLAGQDAPAYPPPTIGSADVFAAGTGLVSTDPTSLATGLSLRAYPLDQAPAPCATYDDGGGFPVIYSCPRFATPLAGTVATAPVLSDDLSTVFVGTDAGVVYAVEVASGAVVWTADVESPVTADPAVADGALLVPTASSGLVALSADGCGASTCGVDWTTASSAAVVRQPAAAGGAVWAATEDGALAAYPTGGCGTAVCDPVWQVDLGASFTAPLAIGSGRLFATVDGTMHVFAPSPG